MLIIRPEQMDVFQQHAFHSFEDRMVRHIRKHFTHTYEYQGEKNVREVVRYADRQARAYGFETQRSLCLYLTVCYMFGACFDEDPLLPWARDILKTKPVVYPEYLIDDLADKALEVSDQVHGPDSKHLIRAFIYLRKYLPRLKDEPDWDPFHERMIDMLEAIFPARFEAVDAASINNLIEQGLQQATGYGLTKQNGLRLFLVGKFLFGTHCDRDPMWARLAEPLHNPNLLDEQQRITMLYQNAAECLAAYLKIIPEEKSDE